MVPNPQNASWVTKLTPLFPSELQEKNTSNMEGLSRMRSSQCCRHGSSVYWGAHWKKLQRREEKNEDNKNVGGVWKFFFVHLYLGKISTLDEYFADGLKPSRKRGAQFYHAFNTLVNLKGNPRGWKLYPHQWGWAPTSSGKSQRVWVSA